MLVRPGPPRRGGAGTGLQRLDLAEPDRARFVRHYRRRRAAVFYSALGQIGRIAPRPGAAHPPRAARRRRPRLSPSLPTGVPDCSEITSSPGTRLAYRLPLAGSPAWDMFGLLLACLLWNGIVAASFVLAVGGHLAGRPDWLLTLFIVPFLLVGVAFIVLFVRQMFADHRYRTDVAGIPAIRSTRQRDGPGVRLAIRPRENPRPGTCFWWCEEEATYRQGTNTRTETHQVYRQEVAQSEEADGGGTMPLEASDTRRAAGRHALVQGRTQRNSMEAHRPGRCTRQRRVSTFLRHCRPPRSAEASTRRGTRAGHRGQRPPVAGDNQA